MESPWELGLCPHMKVTWMDTVCEREFVPHHSEE